MEPVINDDLRIAQFMGAVIADEWFNEKKEHDHYLLDMGKNRLQNERYWSDKTLKYSSNWEWLMPVVKKIEDTYDVEVTIHKMYCDIDGIITADVTRDRRLSVYYAVANFLKKLDGKEVVYRGHESKNN